MDLKQKVKDHLKVDPFNLVEDWEQQPHLFMFWSEKWVDAVLRKENAKQQLETLRANLDLDIRQNPEAYGILKITESVVDSAIKTHPEYQQLLREYNQLCSEVNFLSSVKEALNHKRKALESLTQLWVTGYYQHPNESKIARETEDLVRKRQLESLNQSMKKILEKEKVNMEKILKARKSK